MKRLLFASIFFLFSIFIFGCSTGLENTNTSVKKGSSLSTGSGSTQPGSGRTRGVKSGPTDIKSLSTILERSGHSLTEAQVNYLLKLNTGPEFTEKMVDVLTDEQLDDLKTSKGRGGRRR